MSIPGHATAEATRQYYQQFSSQIHSQFFPEIGRPGWKVNKIAFQVNQISGNYDILKPALQFALQNGVNIIDVSPFSPGRETELAVAEVLNRVIVWQGIPREQIVVVNRVGWVQGEDLQRLQQRERQKRRWPMVTRVSEDRWHCLYPRFIQDQLAKSLATLQLDTIDIYLVESPELLLPIGENISHEERFQSFLNGMRAVLRTLEELVEEGFIQFYGIVSPALLYPAQHTYFLPMEWVWHAYNLACTEKAITPEQGHFVGVAFPFNFYEHHAIRLKNQPYAGAKYTLMELIRKLGLAAIGLRPLEAWCKGERIFLDRLNSENVASLQREWQHHWRNLQQLEKEFHRFLKSVLSPQQFSGLWGSGAPSSFADYAREVVQDYVFSRDVQVALQLGWTNMVATLFQRLPRYLPPQWWKKAQTFQQALHREMQLFTQKVVMWSAASNSRRVNYLQSVLHDFLPESVQRLSFPQQVLWALCHFPEIKIISYALSRIEQVKEVLELQSIPLQDVTLQVFDHLPKDCIENLTEGT